MYVRIYVRMYMHMDVYTCVCKYIYVHTHTHTHTHTHRCLEQHLAAAARPHYRIVAAIAQPKGYAYFHFLLENLAKVHSGILAGARDGSVVIQASPIIPNPNC
jgi:hypothetical protein